MDKQRQVVGEGVLGWLRQSTQHHISSACKREVCAHTQYYTIGLWVEVVVVRQVRALSFIHTETQKKRDERRYWLLLLVLLLEDGEAPLPP